LQKKGYRNTQVVIWIKNTTNKKIQIDLRELGIVYDSNKTQKVGGIQSGLRLANKIERRIFTIKPGKKKSFFIQGLFSQPIPKGSIINGLYFEGKYVPFIFKD
jgi:hypothetical protein